MRASTELRETIKPRPLAEDLDAYWTAPSGKGPLAADWADKPHRLVNDLIAALLHNGQVAAKPDAGAAAAISDATARELNVTFQLATVLTDELGAAVVAGLPNGLATRLAQAAIAQISKHSTPS